MPPALKQTSLAESGIWSFALVAMHIRSDAASAPPKAQQQPQFDWSRISFRVLLQAGQFVADSNESGTATASMSGCGAYSSISP